MIADAAAEFFFPKETKWTSLTQIRLTDKSGKSAGNIDVVLASYDDRGCVTDFGALEIQAVYISGNIREAFAHYMGDPAGRCNMDWTRQRNYPRPDYLSSSRKRLAPQLIYKGCIINGWRKKMAVAVGTGFFETLPSLPQVEPGKADIAWLVYDLKRNETEKRYNLVRNRTVYTRFRPALDKITTAEPGPVEDFLGLLQEKLNEVQRNGESVSPDAPTLTDILDI